MLENQLLRKQKGGTAPTLEINGDSGVADGAAAGDSINAGPSTDEKIPAGATASAGTNNQTQGATVATASNAQTVDNAPAPPANNGVLGSNNQVGVPAAAALLALNGGGNTNGAPPSQLLGTQAPSTAAHLLSNQAVPAAQLMNGLHSLPGANPASDPLLAARLALAGASGGLGNLNNVGNPAVMPGASQQQPNHAVHALAVNPANLGLGGGQQLQQLAMLLGGAVARPGPRTNSTFALLQAAFGRSIAAASAPTTAAQATRCAQVMRDFPKTKHQINKMGLRPPRNRIVGVEARVDENCMRSSISLHLSKSVLIVFLCL
ncbi:expressed unknown protein [Seminavis robusta]|uniref:Uncharacterized protein n=1 Tax=Seminavis robusta TaxID=568900 RepID=A0A9N8EPA0_9STRA|nr:expressed unknown protein [Seminavis robusta]|eukprot:Sro1362_g266310.1 n/a (320) ;mRNA; r:26282-27335